MDWSVTATKNEGAWLDDYIADVIANPAPELPPHDLRVGHVDAHWHVVSDGLVYVAADGGTADDRVFVESLLEEQLKPFGYKRATVKLTWENPPGYPYPKELPFPPGGPEDRDLDQRRWQIIQNEARQLVQQGRVHLNLNTRNVIQSDVEGDHGNYEVEIHRADPNSMAHTTSHCTCGWGQFQNQPRTRQWKRFAPGGKGRPCKHILATQMQAAATPLDENRAPGNQGQPGQMSLFTPQGPMQAPGSMPLMQQAPGGFAPPMQQPAAPLQLGMPLDQAAGNQLQGLNDPNAQPPSPEEALPQFPMDQQEPHNPISTPGGKPQTPLNPVQYPPGPGGTFSSWQPDIVRHAMGEPSYSNGDFVELLQDDYGTLVGRSEEHGAGQRTRIPARQPGEVLGVHPTTGMVNVLYKGHPWDQNGELEPWGATAWHWPSWLRPRPDLKHHPEYRSA